MHITLESLSSAISSSGGVEQLGDQIEGLLGKLQLLERTGRYSGLLHGILKANDKSNFLALILEATFAYQFESAGSLLEYEVKQEDSHGSSIDFGLRLEEQLTAFFEVRLVQQDDSTRRRIASQLDASGTYAIAKDGSGEQAEALRLQNIARSKVQDKSGHPVKFLKLEPSALNIVVVDVSDVLMDTVDAYDCKLAAYGDPGVPAEYRREVFGLFQEVQASDPDHIQQVASRFEHFRSTIHAILFLFRTPGEGPLDYRLEQVLIWNQRLHSEDASKRLRTVLDKALPLHA